MEINLLSRTSSLTAVDTTARLQDGGNLPGPVIAAVLALNKSELMGNDRQLQFARDTSTRQTIIQIVDRKTGEVLEQIPPKQILEIMRDLNKKKKDESNL